MSFSTEIKEELSKITNLANKQCVKAEFIGYLLTGNIDVINSRKIKFSTESEYNINRFAKLLSNLQINKYEINIQGKTFIITFNNQNVENLSEITIQNKKIIIDFEKLNYNEEILKKAIVRGTFLGSGSVNNPEKKYHLEITFSNIVNLNHIEKILNEFGIIPKNMEKNNKEYSLYFKEGEQISKFLAFIGANSAVLKFEDIRVFREMKNNINRVVNCETANLNKTIDAAKKQIEDIEFIKSKKKFGELSESLKEIAELRIKNPDASLIELGKLLKNPVGKSGVNYRLKAISKIAEELR